MVDEKSLVNGNICVANKFKSQDSNLGLYNCIIGVGKIRIVFFNTFKVLF